MKKIPTLFERQYKDHRVVGITDKVGEGLECVLDGEGTATLKWDGSCCMIRDGRLYKRYDAKKGKKPPTGAIPCCEPDPITGHWPHWVEVKPFEPADKWFMEAFENFGIALNGTYEAVGPHFQGNPYDLKYDILVPHGDNIVDVERSFEGIKNWLENNNVEGIVFWRDGEPLCKIKRSDFGLPWPAKDRPVYSPFSVKTLTVQTKQCALT